MISFYKKKVNHYLLALLPLLGCEPKSDLTNLNIAPRCIESQAECSIKNDLGTYTLLLDVEQVVSETPFNYYLSYQGEHQLVSVQGYLEGKNMYMGKIPVFFELPSPDDKWKGQGLLGSCSEDVMHWDLHLLITLQDLKTEQERSEKITFSFSSRRF